MLLAACSTDDAFPTDTEDIGPTAAEASSTSAAIEGPSETATTMPDQPPIPTTSIPEEPLPPTTGTLPLEEPTIPPTFPIGELIDLFAEEPELTRPFAPDVSCTFEIVIGNNGPDDAENVVLFADIDNAGIGLSASGEFSGPSEIPAGSTAEYGGRLGMNMDPPGLYFISGYVEVNGTRELEFSSPLAKTCPDRQP